MKSHAEQLDDLQKLSQQITKQQELLKIQEEYLNNVPLETKIAAAHLEQLKKDKIITENELIQLNSDVKEIKTFLSKYLKSSEDKQNKADDALAEKELKVVGVEKKIKDVDKILNSIKEESATRKRYLLEQEKIITHMMIDANESINKAHDIYAQLERSISSMEIQKGVLNGEMETLLLDKNTLENDVSTLEDDNNTKYEEAQKQLRKVQSEMEEVKAQRELFLQDIECKRQEIRADVESIDAKRAALYKENEELQIAKRRDTSARALYDL